MYMINKGINPQPFDLLAEDKKPVNWIVAPGVVGSNPITHPNIPFTGLRTQARLFSTRPCGD